MRNKVVFYLNGKRHEVGAKESSMMLAEYLRYDKAQTGTKIVCAEGDCGACSVLRYFPHVKEGTDTQNYIPINSCIALVAQLDGSSLITVEGLKEGENLHESQRAMVECHGSQCGFCTPGFVVTLSGLMEEKLARGDASITESEAKNCLTGNLCRCTGYQAIINAAQNIDLKKSRALKERYYSEEQKKDLESVFQEPVSIQSEEFSFFAPKSISEAVNHLAHHPDTRILGSGTDLGVIHNKRKQKLMKVMGLHLIEELYSLQEDAGEIFVGAKVTHTEFRHFMKPRLPELANYLDIFASPQIKNIATIIGNVANASPIGDTPPALLALKAEVLVHGPKGARTSSISDFFLAYRKVDLAPGEIITGIKFKLPTQNSAMRLFKNSNRKDLDISAVNLAVKVDWTNEKRDSIADVTIAAGGVSATPIRFKKTEDFLKQNSLTKTTLEKALKLIHTEFTPLSDVRASSAYRHVLIENYLKQALTEIGGIA